MAPPLPRVATPIKRPQVASLANTLSLPSLPSSRSHRAVVRNAYRGTPRRSYAILLRGPYSFVPFWFCLRTTEVGLSEGFLFSKKKSSIASPPFLLEMVLRSLPLYAIDVTPSKEGEGKGMAYRGLFSLSLPASSPLHERTTLYFYLMPLTTHSSLWLKGKPKRNHAPVLFHAKRNCKSRCQTAKGEIFGFEDTVVPLMRDMNQYNDESTILPILIEDFVTESVPISCPFHPMFHSRPLVSEGGNNST
jgi:hypothetical protein